METPEVRAVGESRVELGDAAVTGGVCRRRAGSRLVVVHRTVDGDTVFAVGGDSAADPDARERIEALFATAGHH
jgi:hypothetical protein